MKSSFYKGVVLGAVVAALTLEASAALAGTGVGGIFNLGQGNSVNATSTLKGSANGRQLQVTNTSTGNGATGIGIKVASDRPPLTVSSQTQVPNLNASLLDGKPASAFLPVGGTAANSDKLGGIGPSGYYAAGSTVADSNALGGVGPSGYYAAGSTVANSNQLGGINPSGFVQTTGSVTVDPIFVSIFDLDSQQVLNLDGLKLTENCNSSTGLQATTSVSHSAIRAWGINVSVAQADFNPGDTVGLGLPGNNPFETIVYSHPDGQSVVAVLSNDAGLYGSRGFCDLAGYVMARG